MTDRLRVHVNRASAPSVEPEAGSFHVEDPFEVVLTNHGRPAHVHVRADDALAAVASFPEDNWYLETDETRTIPVDVRSIDEVAGGIEVTTGFGAERATVDVTVAAGTGGVDVDDSLGEVATAREDPDHGRPSIVAGAFVAAGIVVAILVTVLVDDALALAAGLIAVALAVGAALAVLALD
ncbi:MAG: hypothetical protein ABEJ77_02335 [Halanaeroarchaeum sp.]